MVCRFYGYTLDEVSALTLTQFNLLSVNMVKIIEMENPTPEDEKAKPLSSANLAGIVGKRKKQ